MSALRRTLLALVALAAQAAGPPVPAVAQGVEPGEVRPELPAPAPPPQEDERRLLPPLPAPPAGGPGLDARLVVRVERFAIEGSTVFDAATLAQVVEPWTGRELGTEELLAARDAVTDLYVAHGYATSGAVLPDQDVAGGVVRLVVVEGLVSEVSVRGNRRFRAHYFEQRLMRASRAPVQVARLEAALQLLQRDPWIERVDALLEPGERLGESRLVLAVTEAPQWNVRLEGGNQRSPTVGSGGVSSTGQIANLLGVRDVWTSRFEWTEGVRDIEARFEVPVTPWDTELRLRFRDTHSEIVEQPFGDLDIAADARTYGVSLFQPVYRSESDEVWLELTGEHRRTRSEVLGERFCFEVAGPDCDEPTAAVLRVGGQWTRRTRRDVFALRSLVSFGIDALGATVGGPSHLPDGEFVSWLGQAQWAHALPERLLGSYVVLRADAQLANDPLLSIEKFAVGGYQTVRGYRENRLVRDNGVVVSGELRIPVWRDALRRHRLELVPFMDYGHGWNEGIDLPDDTLWSAGAGLRFMPRDGVLAEFTWGKRLKSVSHPDDSLQDHGIHMSISIDAPTVF